MMVWATDTHLHHPVLLCVFLSLSAQALSDDVAFWTSPRTNLLGDSIYINGGDMFLGSPMAPTKSSINNGDMLWRLDLSSSYILTQNLSILEPIFGPVTYPLSPFYVAGAMLANYDGLMTYGGMQSEDSSDPSRGMYTYKSSSDTTDAKLINGTVGLPQSSLETDPWAWYRCCGAGVSAPSESLAFYFGGLTASTPIPILYNTNQGDLNQPSTPNGDSIICNTTNLHQPVCERLPTADLGIEPRAESELIWLPYGDQGLLLSMGGIEVPSDLSVTGLLPTYNSTNTGTNNYMTSILVFDISSRQWEAQQVDLTAPENPTQLASFCSVVATAQDGKSHHIYIYGGYDGMYNDPAAYDAIWVLSIPAFRWTKISDGVATHRRQNHKCVKTSPSQFFSIGGNMEYGLGLNSSYIYVYDMNGLAWNSSYDPTYWSEYEVPEVIKKNVPNLNTIPDNLVPQVKTWLSTPYKGPKIEQLGPYAKPTLLQYAKRHGASWWLATTVAVLAYLTLASCALIMVVILRRRMAYRSANIDMSDMTSKSRLVRWMHNAPVMKADSMSEVEMLKSPEHYTDSITESYVDDERSEHVTALGQTKLSGTQVTTYEPLTVEFIDDIKLSSFTDSNRMRTQ